MTNQIVDGERHRMDLTDKEAAAPVEVTKAGNIGKAARELVSSGIHEPSNETLAALEEKHPQLASPPNPFFKYNPPKE